MVHNFILRILMGKKKVGQKPDLLSAKPLEYVSKCSTKDITDADLRRTEVTLILEEILRLGRRRIQKQSQPLEIDKDAA